MSAGCVDSASLVLSGVHRGALLKPSHERLMVDAWLFVNVVTLM